MGPCRLRYLLTIRIDSAPDVRRNCVASLCRIFVPEYAYHRKIDAGQHPGVYRHLQAMASSWLATF